MSTTYYILLQRFLLRNRIDVYSQRDDVSIVSRIAKAEADMGNALKILEEHLWKGGEKKKYLVTDHSITLADIVLASTLVYPFQLVFDESFLRPYSNVVDWFETCVNQPEFQAVVGKVELKCQRESVLPSS